MSHSSIEQAQEFVETIENPVDQYVTGYFLQQAILVLAADELPPDTNFLSLVKVVARALHAREMLIRMLNGERFDWGWPDEDTGR